MADGSTCIYIWRATDPYLRGHGHGAGLRRRGHHAAAAAAAAHALLLLLAVARRASLGGCRKHGQDLATRKQNLACAWFHGRDRIGGNNDDARQLHALAVAAARYGAVRCSTSTRLGLGSRAEDAAMVPCHKLNTNAFSAQPSPAQAHGINPSILSRRKKNPL